MDEAQDWVEGKAKECEDPSKPPRIRANYKTSEYWMVRDRGTDFEKASKVSEKMERDGGDLPAGLAILGGDPEENPKKAKVNAADRHKAVLGKVVALNGKLCKSIGQAEGLLPGWKRALSSTAYGSFRAGVARCREAREQIMDKVEDLKSLAHTPEQQEQQIDELKELLRESQEYLDALTESKRQYDPAPAPPATSAIKNEALKPKSHQGQLEDGKVQEEALDGTNPQT